MLTYLRKGETYVVLAIGIGVGVITVFRYIREVLDVLAACAIGLNGVVTVAARKAFVILDGTLLRIGPGGHRGGADRGLRRSRR